jgi:nucleoside-diphosphate-sugar epimerase
MVFKPNCGITGHTGGLGSEFLKNNNFNFIKFKGNITNRDQVNKWIKLNNFDLIIHFAAIVPINKVNRNYSKAKNVNYFGTKNLINCIVKNKKNLKWFFFSSTSHVYKFSKKKLKENSPKQPITKYGVTKYKAEQYISKILSKYKIAYCIGRIFSFTNSKQSSSFLIPSIKNKLSQKKKIINFKNLNHYRDFLTTRDICRAIYFLWKKRFCGIINIGSGKFFFLKNIVRALAKEKKVKLLFFDNPKSTHLVADVSKIKRLGWFPRNRNIFNFGNK